jgi:pimeloyl-ACP methyl ester carboxylesterase
VAAVAFVSLALVAARGAPAQAARAGAAGAAGTVDPLVGYTGLYRIGAHHEVAISLRRFGKQSALVFSDLNTDEIRLLFPDTRDRFTAGAELTKPTPVAYRIAFTRDAAGRVVSLALRDSADRDLGTGARGAARAVPVRFTGAGGVELRGTVHLPPERAGGGRRAAVVLAHGSEDSDRYGFDALPHVLAEHGLIVLAYDKRGTGESSGSWEDAGLDDLARDLVAGIRLLAARPDVHPGRIGVIGFSEGGWVAPLAASLSDSVRFIVSISGGAFTKGVSFVHKYRRQFEEQGMRGDSLIRALDEKEAIIAASAERVRAGRQPSGFDRRVTYDPGADWRAFTGPVLYMVGEDDSLEPASQSVARLREVLLHARHSDFTIKLFPRGHHALLLGTTGRPSEFATMRGIGRLVPGYWDVLLRWLAVRGFAV